MRRCETMACVVAAAGAMALGGCGGGDAPQTTTGGAPAVSTEQAAAAAAAYQGELRAYARELRQAGGKLRTLARLADETPALEQLASDEPSYVAARETAADVDAVAAELGVIAGSDPKADAKLYNRLYGMAADEWDRGFKRNGRHYDETAPIVYEGDYTDAEQERVHRIWIRYMSDELRAWARYGRRLGTVPARTALYRSFLAYERMEIEEARDVMREFRAHLRERPLERTYMGFFTSQATKFSAYPIPVPVMWRKDERLARGFARSIDRLADGRSASVGDAYRTVIARSFVSPLRKAELRDSIVTQQLWMLSRIRELEDTPEDAYEAARQTILLQGIDDARNPYGRLIEIYAAADGNMSAGERRVPPRLKAYLAWSSDQLERVKAPILQPTVRAMRRGLEQVPKVRSKVLFKTLNDYVEATNRIERDMRAGARRVDSPKRLKAATVKALDATRPEPEQPAER